MQTAAAVSSKKSKKMDVEPEIDVLTPKKKSSSSSKKNKDVKDKKSKKDKRDKKDKKKDKKKSKEIEVVPTVDKKRKASAISTTTAAASDKKGGGDVSSVETIMKWLGMIQIIVDEKQLRLLKTQRPALFNELVQIMNDPPRGFIFSYLVKTPTGRMFWYDEHEDKFKSVHDHLNLIKLTQYDKESSLNIHVMVQMLTPEQRRAALESLNMSEAQSDTIKPEQWLFALIEGKIIERRTDAPDYTHCAEPCLLHDISTKQTYWLGSKSGKARLSQVIVSRARQVTAKNIDAEYEILTKKRLEIIAFLQKVGSPTPTAPKKKKANEQVEEPKQKKQKKEASSYVPETPEERQQRIKANVAAVLKEKLAAMSSDSEETSKSDSDSFSFDDNKPQKLEMDASTQAFVEGIKKKQQLGHVPVLGPNPTTLAKSLEVKRIIEGAARSTKILNQRLDPHVTWFTENCA